MVWRSRRACRPTASRRRSGSDSPWRRRRRRRGRARNCRRRRRGPGRARNPAASGSARISVERGGGELVDHRRRAARASAARSAAIGAARIPAEHALRAGGEQRPGRIDDPVADRPDDGGVEHPQPPARQRRVQFADAVPFMAGGRGAGDARRCPDACCRLPLCQSSSSGMRAASSNFFLFDGQKRVDEDGEKHRDEVEQAPGLGEFGDAVGRSRS